MFDVEPLFVGLVTKPQADWLFNKSAPTGTFLAARPREQEPAVLRTSQVDVMMKPSLARDDLYILDLAAGRTETFGR